MAGVIVHRIGVFFDGVPFIDQYNGTLPGFQDETGDVGILGSDPGFRVNDQQGNVGAFYGFE